MPIDELLRTHEHESNVTDKAGALMAIMLLIGLLVVAAFDVAFVQQLVVTAMLVIVARCLLCSSLASAGQSQFGQPMKPRSERDSAGRAVSEGQLEASLSDDDMDASCCEAALLRRAPLSAAVFVLVALGVGWILLMAADTPRMEGVIRLMSRMCVCLSAVG